MVSPASNKRAPAGVQRPEPRMFLRTTRVRTTKGEVDASGVIVISLECFERCRGTKKLPIPF